MAATKMRDDAVLLVARVLTCTIFITSGIAKIVAWDDNIEFIARRPLPFKSLLLALALAIELGGGALVIAGFKTKWAAWVMFLYMIPVTFLYHTFGSTQFQKNLGIMGALLMLAVCGAGGWSLEERHLRRAVARPVSVPTAD